MPVDFTRNDSGQYVKPTPAEVEWMVQQAIYWGSPLPASILKVLTVPQDSEPEPEPLKRRDKGRQTVYFFKVKEYVKIGRANDWKRRLSELQTGCPYDVIPLLVLRGDHEAELHRKFRADRASGEWFRFSPAIETFIKKNIDKSILGETI